MHSDNLFRNAVSSGWSIVCERGSDVVLRFVNLVDGCTCTCFVRIRKSFTVSVCYVWFVPVCNLQSTPHSFEIVRAHFANFWSKRDANLNPNPDPDHNRNPSQVAQRILQIAQTDKSCATYTERRTLQLVCCCLL